MLGSTGSGSALKAGDKPRTRCTVRGVQNDGDRTMEHRLHQRVRIRIAVEITFKGVRTDNLYTRDISSAGVFIETEASSLPLLSLVQVTFDDIANGVQVKPMAMLVVHKSATGVGLMSIKEETAITAIANVPRAHLSTRVHQPRYAHRR